MRRKLKLLMVVLVVFVASVGFLELDLDVTELRRGQQRLPSVLANLLLNAIHHGGAGVIRVRVEMAAAAVDNAPGTADAGSGFGLGLQLVERLLQRFGWRVRRMDGERISVGIEPAVPI